MPATLKTNGETIAQRPRIAASSPNTRIACMGKYPMPKASSAPQPAINRPRTIALRPAVFVAPKPRIQGEISNHRPAIMVSRPSHPPHARVNGFCVAITLHLLSADRLDIAAGMHRLGSTTGSTRHEIGLPDISTYAVALAPAGPARRGMQPARHGPACLSRTVDLTFRCIPPHIWYPAGPSDVPPPIAGFWLC